MGFTINKNITSVLIINFIIFLLFAIIYYDFKTEFSNMNDLVDAIYFTSMTQSTVGYGDIVPKTRKMKCVVAVHHIIIILLALRLIIAIVN